MNEESRFERVKRFAKIWWQSRAEAKKSQEFMALGLGVSKKTVQNWEKGASSPNLFQGSEWFRLLGVNPVPYYLAFLYPQQFNDIVPNCEDEEVEAELSAIIEHTSTMEKRQLLYIMAGRHGSSWYSLLQMFTAHCHTSMQSRALSARLVLDNYEMEEKRSELVCNDNVKPDVEALRYAVERGKLAAQNGKKGYIFYDAGGLNNMSE